jgi:hypothetical protein
LSPRLVVAALWVVLGVLSCTEAFAPVSTLSAPRVLAIRSSPVELLADGGVLLQALVYLPEGAGDAGFTWTWCPQLGSATTNYACAITAADLAAALTADAGPDAGSADASVTVSYELGTSATPTFTWPVPPELIQTLCVTAPTGGPSDGGADAGSDAGAAAGSDGGTGSATVRLSCSSSLTVAIELGLTAGTTTSEAYRSLTAEFTATRTDNTNPELTALQLPPVDGGDVTLTGGTLAAGRAYALTALLPATASDTYAQSLNGPPGEDAGARTTTRYEGLSVAWYVEQGSLAAATTSLPAGGPDDAGLDTRDWAALTRNTWTVPASTRGPVRLIAVVRDTRLGVGWAEARFTVVGGSN